MPPENPCRYVWLGAVWDEDWSDPPPPCLPGHACGTPVGNGAFVGQVRICDCVTLNPGED